MNNIQRKPLRGGILIARGMPRKPLAVRLKILGCGRKLQESITGK
jgi:hypothetical protein